MRIFSPSLALGAVLIAGLSGSSLMAQDQSQPAPGAAPAASAQAPSDAQPRHTPNPHRQAKKMAKKLGLSPDRQSKIEPILADRAQQMQSARADGTLAPNDKRAKIRDINQNSDSQIEAILSDTQKQQYEQMKQSHKASRAAAGRRSFQQLEFSND